MHTTLRMGRNEANYLAMYYNNKTPITQSDGLHALCNIIKYLDFHSTKRALWLDDSRSRAPDQIQIYYDRDTIAQFLPARRLQQHMIV